MFKRGLVQDHQLLDPQIKTLEREINLAKNIQTKLLNGERPKLENSEVLGISIPARLIGGDYFDFYPLPNGKIRIVIGDVMGKGIPAAMLMILTRGAFRTAAESTKGPGETLTAMNNALYRDLRILNSFVTVFCADWDSTTWTFSYASAGHSLPEVIRKDTTQFDIPSVRGIMLGGLPNQVYKEEKVTLAEGDLVFLYTDGIVEAVNKANEMYKVDRLKDVLRSVVSKNIKTIEETVIEDIKVFTEGLPQRDDITMVLLKIGKESSEISSYNAPLV
ncbi:serine/threonine protein phosphatase [Ureibacillus massiliensis 4400831 = CIP 108448 = CCUG 49529]|uniref:Serine/threonine protein phosphatase n=1 Tax=Ureibacillus massiliensis 4400831 = CIP 108448 = CCUG 49529 TaxID=1211035 RepID=A0A0A3J033_9BACL|nr:PP2C family protein-serine/threonine phosphatase [Ureibacillus massiliensis]KGR90271.1 serine/threonine protein phosphatase [Ureibacillus massiliensis 4400831 = CIP 108448 = CCUG 49529]